MDFTAFDLRIGTVTAAAHTDDGALALTIALGGGQERTATAYVTESYSPETILGRQVVAVTNAGAAREAVVLAAVSPSQGAVLLQPDRPVADGTQVV